MEYCIKGKTITAEDMLEARRSLVKLDIILARLIDQKCEEELTSDKPKKYIQRKEKGK